MISKLPRWVEYGAFLLAALAGTVNAIGLLGFDHQAITHLSGTITQLGTSLIKTDSSWAQYSHALHLMCIVLSFMLGAAFSGFYIESSALKLGRRYGIALFTEGSLLLIALYYLASGSFIGQYFASAACGLQNAMLTTFSGAIVRTTHMTGIITDLGIMIGEKLKGKPFDHRKGKLFLWIISGFLSGGSLGAFLFIDFNVYAFAFPSGLAFIIALYYSLYSYWSKNHNKNKALLENINADYAQASAAHHTNKINTPKLID